MSGAEDSLARRIVTLLSADSAVVALTNAIILADGGRSKRPGFPWIEVGDAIASDWSAKGVAGREIRISVTVHDAPERSDRARSIAGAMDSALDALPRNADGWRLVSFVFQKSLMLREKDRCRLVSDWRARILAIG